MDTLKMRWHSERPLLMHNGRLADPTNRFTKEMKALTGNRKKTDEDYLELKRIEWLGGLHLDQSGCPAIPSEMIFACVIGGAKKSKNGTLAKGGILCSKAYYPLTYDGPKTVEEMWRDQEYYCDYRLVRVQQARTMRARPRFEEWSLDVELMVDETVINVRAIKDAAEAAGKLGIGDYRPQFGRFRVEHLD